MKSSSRAVECECDLHFCNMLLNLPEASFRFATEAVFQHPMLTLSSQTLTRKLIHGDSLSHITHSLIMRIDSLYCLTPSISDTDT